MDRDKLDSIIELASAALLPGGYECIEAEWDSGEHILRLFVDHRGTPEAVITLEECVKASKLLDGLAALDEAVSGAYTLEVSSPGVERPLRRRRDFERFIGQMVEVKLADKVQDRKHGKGRLLEVASADGERDVVISLETTRGVWQFPLATLQRASLVYDWGDR